MAINVFVFLLSFLPACSLSAASVFSSIDCGSSTSYKDDFGITWTGDDEYIQTGESRSIGNTGNEAAMNTLRVFTSPTKNCYNIPGEQGTKILLRASFYYGNYDSQSTPPSFDLLFDGNFWDTITTTPDTVIYREVTYIPKWKNISLCLGQKYTKQFPIISAIEVRGLGSNIYSLKDISEYPLLLSQRTDYTWGSTNKVVRYNNDEYDRIWTRFSWSALREKGWEDLTSNASTIDVSKTSDNPPALLLDYGVQTANTSTNLVLDVSTLSSTEVAVYINMYFTEVWNPAYLNSSERRSFDIYLDNQIIAKDFSPVFAVATEISKINVSASSASNFYLAATSNSTLPPLIMGVELFVVGTALANGTNTKDVSGLASLQQGFSALQEWSGEPCLPAEYPWEWVKCTSDSTPRVTSLLLSNYKLSGKLPDFSSLDVIQSIDLSNNNIGGSIPDFLASFSNLTYLNLANNNFSGQIPQWLYQKNNLKFDISGNQYLCNGTSCQKATSNGGGGVKKWLAGVLGGVIPPLAVAGILGGVRTWSNRKKKANDNPANASSGDSRAPRKWRNWRKKQNSQLSGSAAGQPTKEEEIATPQRPLMQSGTNNKNLSRFITDEVVAPAVHIGVDHVLDIQPSPTTTT